MDRRIVPPDSILNLWLDGLRITETPWSYLMLCGLSAIGASLKRNVFIDDKLFRTYPNLSVLLVGPSGIGKDTSINFAMELVDHIGTIEKMGGKTIDVVKERLLEVGDPAAGMVPAQELTAFLGGKDYQRSMVQELTDLMSTGETLDVSTKGEYKEGGARVIVHPTVTIQGGSTAEWLLKAMPDGSLDGGFLPRFLIACEDAPRQHVPWVKYSNTPQEVREASIAKAKFFDEAKRLVHKWLKRKPWEVTPDADARDYYTNWYMNRYNLFSPITVAYAHRSRLQMHRLGMLMAITRGKNYTSVEDYQFAAAIMQHVACGLDRTIAPMYRGRKENGGRKSYMIENTTPR